MAVSVDTVYKTILFILNKEQRGYITPEEFNKISEQVQLEIFEKYFEDLNQQLRVPENDSEYANRVKNVDEKIDIFKRVCPATYSTDYFYLPNGDIRAATISAPGTGYSTSGVPQATTGGSGGGCTVNIVATAGAVTSFTIADSGSGYQVGDVLTISGGGGNATITVTTICDPLHRLGTVMYQEKEIQRIQRNDYLLVNKSPLTTPTNTYPVYILEGTVLLTALHDKIYVYPNSIQSGVTVSYVTKPTSPIWGYTVNTTTGAFIYASGSSTDFQLHPSEQTELILNILMYCGVIIRDPQIVQNAAQMVQQDEVNAKS